MVARFRSEMALAVGAVMAMLSAGAAGSLGVFPQNAAPPPADANILAQIGALPQEARVFANRPGFCLDLGCGDGRFAAEIARKTKYTVFAVAKDEADRERTRQALDKANLYDPNRYDNVMTFIRTALEFGRYPIDTARLEAELARAENPHRQRRAD